MYISDDVSLFAANNSEAAPEQALPLPHPTLSDAAGPASELDAVPAAAASEVRQGAPRPRRALRWGMAVVVVAALGAGGFYLQNQVSALHGTAAAAAAPAGPVPVSVAVVEQRDTMAWATFSGRLEAIGRVEIRPRVAGAIVEAHFLEGAPVKQGDKLFTIDPAPYAAAVERSEGAFAAAEARLVLAAKDQQRGFRLGSTNDLAQNAVDQRVNEFHAAEANLRSTKAALDISRLDLAWTEVRAPISGRVGKIEVTPGNLVPAGSAAPVLTTLVSVDPIYASFEADEQSVADVIASLSVAGLPAGSDMNRGLARIPVQMGTLNVEGTPLRGTLQLIDNVVAGSSGTVRLRAVFANPNGALMPGQFARLRLGQAHTAPALAIDERAIGTDQDHRFVLVVDDANTVGYRAVQLGGLADGLRIVTSGLQPGERVVVNGLQRVRPGSVVAPQIVAMAPAAPATLAQR